MTIPDYIRLLTLIIPASLMGTADLSAQTNIAFNPAPKANDPKGWTIQNFGPVGIGIDLEQGFVMKINNVEAGSPAAKTGQLQKGQVIKSINGVRLKDDYDPRIVLGQLITNAEASDGRITLDIQGQGDVTVTIPVLGSYSPTWPLNCPKSDKIVRNLADRIAEHGKNDWSGMLFLLSTGEEKDLAVVREWIQNGASVGGINWSIGMSGMAFCEYYLRTGDQSVLPTIQKGADHLRDHIYNGAWAGRASGNFLYQNGGHVNASGVHCLTFLLLAKACGVNVDEFTLQSSLRHFYRYSGRGSVPYGDFTSKPGFRDCNGKTGGLAMAMAAARRLTPDGDNSIYAQAAHVSAIKDYYGINVYHIGHTGGGIGEIWKSTAMALLADERPDQYRQYMDARRWALELSRRHDGGIGIAGGKDDNYDRAVGEHNIAWGTFFALNYTLPRKKLFLYGAPSPYAKSYQLPLRPWGTPADDAFSSPYPVPGGPWTRGDVHKEKLEKHIGDPVYEILRSDKVSDRDLVTYLHHPEITHRFEAKQAVVRLRKNDIVRGLLLSSDPRLQHMGVMALHDLLGTWSKSNMDPGMVTPEMWAQVEKIIREPHRSEYVRGWALGLLRHLDIDELRNYKDVLLKIINDSGHGGAISASIPLLSDPESYKELFPPIARAISESTSFSMISSARQITQNLDKADPEIQEYGLNIMKKVYKILPDDMMSENGRNVIGQGGGYKRKMVGQVIGFSDEGRGFLNSLPKVTSEWKVSGRDSDRFIYSGRFQPNPAFVGAWCLVDHDQFENRAEAENFLKKRLTQNKVPTEFKSRGVNYGFKVDAKGQVEPVSLTKRAYEFPMRYSGNMAFSTYDDKAYHYEVISLGGRDFLLFELGFDSEPDPGFKAKYKTYVKVE
ncbi:hypothetical protein DDZ13_02530 [Coraliomargarita sinensis]|uniref:PDZ domain-containing protein n=1 Tax=Coraliomargarita sinensis TaxID=2174842 RepID=A0A317ZM15_9BACT|nr:DUF6288 domain-containing protein [Coraliomargarita sinensis]PXA04859.1 hypothetical protein DDZ13_02530 [Coraliomargarita sinensis]